MKSAHQEWHMKQQKLSMGSGMVRRDFVCEWFLVIALDSMLSRRLVVAQQLMWHIYTYHLTNWNPLWKTGSSQWKLLILKHVFNLLTYRDILEESLQHNSSSNKWQSVVAGSTPKIYLTEDEAKSKRVTDQDREKKCQRKCEGITSGLYLDEHKLV